MSSLRSPSSLDARSAVDGAAGRRSAVVVQVLIGAAATGRRSAGIDRKASVHPSSVRATQSCNCMVRYSRALARCIAGIESQCTLPIYSSPSPGVCMAPLVADQCSPSCQALAVAGGSPLKRSLPTLLPQAWMSDNSVQSPFFVRGPLNKLAQFLELRHRSSLVHRYAPYSCAIDALAARDARLPV